MAFFFDADFLTGASKKKKRRTQESRRCQLDSHPTTDELGACSEKLPVFPELVGFEDRFE